MNQSYAQQAEGPFFPEHEEVTKRETQVPLALSVLHSSAMRAAELVDALAARLGPVLSPPTPYEVDQDGQKAMPPCSLASEVNASAEVVHAVGSKLSEILDRLEL